MKKVKFNFIIIFIIIFILIILYYLCLFPPIGSKFLYWEKPESIYISEAVDNIEIKFINIDFERYDKRTCVIFGLKNLTENDIYYDCTFYRLDYFYFYNWKTVDFNIFPIGSTRICYGREEKEDIMLLPKEVISYPGKYRIYLENLGFFEFEISRETIDK